MAKEETGVVKSLGSSSQSSLALLNSKLLGCMGCVEL